ncbi:MAG: PorT family protein [Bacteroidales bacterium]|jgi:hypothetical protein|nr:PorT family protein [Bacteroidales bacterium]
MTNTKFFKRLLCCIILGALIISSFDADAQRRRKKSSRSKGRRGHTEKPIQFGGTLAYQIAGPANAMYHVLPGMLGFTVGGFAQYRVSDLFKLSGELKYSYHTFTVGEGNGLLTYTQNSISIPLMAKIYPVKWLFIEAGVEPRLNLGNAKGKTATIMGMPMGDEREVELEPNVFELGVGGGMGFEVGDNFFFGARFMYGVLPYYKETSDFFNYTIKLNNMFYGVYIGLKF